MWIALGGRNERDWSGLTVLMPKPSSRSKYLRPPPYQCESRGQTRHRFRRTLASLAARSFLLAPGRDEAREFWSPRVRYIRRQRDWPWLDTFRHFREEA